MYERTLFPAQGRLGGLPGDCGKILRERLGAEGPELGDDRAGDSGSKIVEMYCKGRQDVPPSWRLILHTPGGGGFGDPRERLRDQVVTDVLDGVVSLGKAEADYGLDAKTMAVLREEMSSSGTT